MATFRPALVALVLLSAPSVSGLAAPAGQYEFFESKVRPILVNHCGGCHGEKAKMGGLVLTSKAGAFQVIAPGHAERSKLIQAVYADKLKMPPAGKLSSEEISSLEEWIAKGAPWPDEFDTKPAIVDPGAYWAFRPVKKPDAPRVQNDSWARLPIDRFILAGLEKKSLSPARDAGKYTLLRRVTLDLPGLLLTPKEIEAFAKDDSLQAFDRVTRSLKSIANGNLAREPESQFKSFPTKIPPGNCMTSTYRFSQSTLPDTSDFFDAGAVPRSLAAWIALGPFWPSALGMLLVARMAVLIYRWKSREVT